MKKLLSILCFVLLLNSSNAALQTTDVISILVSDILAKLDWKKPSEITDAAFQSFAESEQIMFVSVTLAQNIVNDLASDIYQNNSKTTKGAVDAFRHLATLSLTIGLKISDYLKYQDPNFAVRQISNELWSLMSALETIVNYIAIVDPLKGTFLKYEVELLNIYTETIVKNMRAAARAATSGKNKCSYKPLRRVLGDPTFDGIKNLIEVTVTKLNEAIIKFRTEVQGDSVITYVNDVLTATSKDDVTAALDGIGDIIQPQLLYGLYGFKDDINRDTEYLRNKASEVVKDAQVKLTDINAEIELLQTTSSIKQLYQDEVGNMTNIIDIFQSRLTQSIQEAAQKIENYNGIASKNISDLHNKVVKEVVLSLLVSKVHAKEVVLSTLSQYKTDTGISGMRALSECIYTVVKVFDTNVKSILQSISDTKTSFLNDIQKYLTESVPYEASLNGFTMGLIELNRLIDQTIEAGPVAFGKCCDTSGDEFTEAATELLAGLAKFVL